MPGTIEQLVMLRFKSDTSSLVSGATKAKKVSGETAEAFKKLDTQAKGLNTQAVAVGQSFQTLGTIGGALPGKLGPVAGAVGAVTSAFKGAQGSMLAWGIAATGVIGLAVKFSDEIGSLVKQIFRVNDAFGFYSDEMKEIRKQQALTIDSTQALWDSLFPKEAQMRLQALQKEELAQRQQAARAVALSIRTSRIITAEKTFGPNSTEFLNARDAAEKAYQQAIADLEKRFEDARLRLNSQQESARRGPGEATRAVPSSPGAGFDVGAATIIGTSEFDPGVRGGLGPVGSIARPGGFSGALGRRAGSGLGNIGATTEFLRGSNLDMKRVESDAEKVAKALRETRTEAQQFADVMQTVGDSITGAFEQWAMGADSLGSAIKKALGGTIGDVLLGEAKKHVALGTADFLTGNPLGGAGHLAAAAALGTASGAIRGFLGGGAGGGAGASRGGGLPGAAAGAFSGGAGGGSSSETVYVVPLQYEDQGRSIKRGIIDQLERARRDRGDESGVVVRR